MRKFQLQLRFLILGIVVLAFSGIGWTQGDLWLDDSLDINHLEAISADNAHLIEPVAAFGRGAVNDAAWSPDGLLLATASSSGVYIHQGDDLSLLTIMPDSAGISFNSVNYSADGTRLVAATDTRIFVWDTATSELLREIDTNGDFIVRMQYAEFRIALFVCRGTTTPLRNGCNPSFRVIDATSGDTISEIPLNSGRTYILSPNLTIMSALDEQANLLTLMDAKNGNRLAEFTFDEQMISPIFSHNSELLALYTGTDRVITMNVWNINDLLANADAESLEAFTPIASYSEASERWDTTIAIEFAPDDESILIAQTFSPSLRLSLATESVVMRYNTGTSSARLYRINPVFDTFVSAGSSLLLWQTENSEFVAQSLDYGSAYTYFSFSDDHHTLVASNQYVWGTQGVIWSLESQNPTSTVLTHPSFDARIASIWSASISGDGTTIVYDLPRFDTRTLTESFSLNHYDVGDASQSEVISRNRLYASPVINDEREIMLVDDNLTTLEYWDVNGVLNRSVTLERAPDDRIVYRSSFMPVTYNQDHSILAGALCFTSSRQRLLCNNAEIRLWDTQTGALLMRLGDSTANRINYENRSSLSFVGNYVAAAGCFERMEGNVARCATFGGGMRLWDVHEAYISPSETDDDPQENADASPILVDPIFRVQALIAEPFLPQVSIAPTSNDESVLLALNDYVDTTLYTLSVATGGSATQQRIVDLIFPAFSPDGTLLVGSYSGVIKLFGIPQR